jgi:hypothetical protein
VPESPASVLDLLETDVELDGDLIPELERAEESRVRGDAEVAPLGDDPEAVEDGMTRDEAKLACAAWPSIFRAEFWMSLRSRSVSGLAPPVPWRTARELRSSSAVSVAAAMPPLAASGTVARADQRVISIVRS